MIQAWSSVFRLSRCVHLFKYFYKLSFELRIFPSSHLINTYLIKYISIFLWKTYDSCECVLSYLIGSAHFATSQLILARFLACFRTIKLSLNLKNNVWYMHSYSNNSILEMSFEARNCACNSSLERMKNRSKPFSSINMISDNYTLMYARRNLNNQLNNLKE